MFIGGRASPQKTSSFKTPVAIGHSDSRTEGLISVRAADPANSRQRGMGGGRGGPKIVQEDQ